MTVKDRYVRVNRTWPDPLPALTAPEAQSAAKRLYRLAMGQAFKGTMKLTSGNRYTWVRRGVFFVNPDRGWRELVHDISHYVHYRQHPSRAPHDFRHTALERQLVEVVIAKGWLDGSLRRSPKPKPAIQAVRYQRILARIKSWQTKHKRATTALKTLEKQKAACDRRMRMP